MKKIFSIITILILVFSAATVYGSDVDPYTELQFGTSESVLGIDAVYTVKTENVKSLSYKFASGLSYAQGNLINGELRLCIASSNTIDLTNPVCKVTATLEDGTKVAPELELTKLYYNGVKATENTYIKGKNATLTGETLEVDITAHSDYLSKNYIVLIAAYKENGQMISSSFKAVNFTTQKDIILNFELQNCSEASRVEIYYLTSSYVPMQGTIELNIQ